MTRIFLTIVSVLFLANVVSWLALDSILVQLAAPSPLRWSLAVFIILQICGMIGMVAARLLGHQPGTGMGRPLLSLFFIWNLLLVIPTGVVSLIWAICWALLGFTMVRATPPSPWRTVDFCAVALPFFLAFLATLISLVQLNRFRIHRIKIAIPHLPAALKNFTIVHLSDLHVGKLTKGKVLDDMVAATNELKPDLILLTGDLINMSLTDLPKALAMLSAMKSRFGLFLCEGNHDLIESRVGFEAAIRASDFAFLLNESATISVGEQRVQILGLRWGEGMERGAEEAGSPPENALQRLLAQREPADFTVLLAHHPEAFDAAARAKIPLMLAGHTHGGQLMLSRTIGFGPWLYRYWSGVYQKGKSHLVVSNGAGNWFPLRVNAPAEIIHLTLI